MTDYFSCVSTVGLCCCFDPSDPWDMGSSDLWPGDPKSNHWKAIVKHR